MASIYERRQDYVNAETWYRTCYVKGQIECSKNFIDLILLNEVQVNDVNAIRPFIEARAVCGSHLAREYALAKYHETAAQLPIVPQQTITICGLAGPTDRRERDLAMEAMLAQRRQQSADYYRQHPDQTSEAKALDAAKGAALVLGALVIIAAAMPASGEGSIACNKYRNGYPGYDSSACAAPSNKVARIPLVAFIHNGDHKHSAYLSCRGQVCIPEHPINS